MSALGEDSSPSEVAEELLLRLNAEDWAGATELHTPDFVEFEVTHALKLARPTRRLPTVDGLLKSDPLMPREVAEYEVERAERDPPPNPFFGHLYGVESEDDLAGLSSADIFARHLQGADYRWRWRQHIDALISRHPRYVTELEAKRSQISSPWGSTVAGHVEFGERGFVIVGTPTDPPGEFPLDHAPQVMVFRRLPGGWRLSSSILPGYTTVFGPVRVQDASGEWVNLT